MIDMDRVPVDWIKCMNDEDVQPGQKTTQNGKGGTGEEWGIEILKNPLYNNMILTLVLTLTLDCM